MEIIKISNTAIKKVISIIKSGGVVICPTDTVYGFLALALNKKGVDRIFKIKKRSKSKPLSIFVKDFKMAREIAFISTSQEKFIKKHWPGKYTFILKRKSNIKLYGIKKDTIAIRIPKYRFLNNLLKKINRPLVQTSVNISGELPLIKISDIKTKFGELKFEILIIDAGNLKKSKPSKIIDLTSTYLTRLR